MTDDQDDARATYIRGIVAAHLEDRPGLDVAVLAIELELARILERDEAFVLSGAKSRGEYNDSRVGYRRILGLRPSR